MDFFRVVSDVKAELLWVTPVSDAVEAAVQIGIADHEPAGAFLQGHAGELLDAAEVFVVAAELQTLQVVPVVDAMPDPGGDFAVIEFTAVEGGVDVGAEVGPEDGEGFAIEPAVADGFQKEVHLKLGVEPARFQARPRASRQRGRAGKIGVVLGKTHGWAIERLRD